MGFFSPGRSLFLYIPLRSLASIKSCLSGTAATLFIKYAPGTENGQVPCYGIPESVLFV